MAAETSTDAEKLLSEHGIRVTKQRVLVLDELAREQNDATAHDLFSRLRGTEERVGLATIYRTLALLSDRGIVDALTHHGDELCYRLCGNTHHHHLTCSECHRVVELADCSLEPWVEEMSAAHGFEATGHVVEVTGICGDCRAA
jgi:Fur family ferric uptake transcriptional regulator